MLAKDLRADPVIKGSDLLSKGGVLLSREKPVIRGDIEEQVLRTVCVSLQSRQRVCMLARDWSDDQKQRKRQYQSAS